MFRSADTLRNFAARYGSQYLYQNPCQTSGSRSERGRLANNERQIALEGNGRFCQIAIVFDGSTASSGYAFIYSF